MGYSVKTFKPKQTGRHFADGIFQIILFSMVLVVLWFKLHFFVVYNLRQASIGWHKCSTLDRRRTVSQPMKVYGIGAACMRHSTLLSLSDPTDIWMNIRTLGRILGHETILCAVYVTIFFDDHNASSLFGWGGGGGGNMTNTAFIWVMTRNIGVWIYLISVANGQPNNHRTRLSLNSMNSV